MPAAFGREVFRAWLFLRLLYDMLNRIPITAAGAEKLKAELDYLKKTARPAVVAAIAEAREKGDLSENAEYDAAREEQSHIEGRIAELEGKIREYFKQHSDYAETVEIGSAPAPEDGVALSDAEDGLPPLSDEEDEGLVTEIPEDL